jgi:hypothetical protein
MEEVGGGGIEGGEAVRRCRSEGRGFEVEVEEVAS